MFEDKQMVTKLGFKFNKLKHINKFKLMDDGELVQALMRQKQVHRTLKTKAFIKSKFDKSKNIKGHFSDQVRKFVKKREGTTGGTIYNTPKGKSVAIHKDYSGSKDFRNLVAHEAFHANIPILGRSEFLAHSYGGWKGVKGGTVGEKAKASIKDIKHYGKTRPFVAANEAVLVGSVSMLGKDLYNKAKDKKS